MKLITIFLNTLFALKTQLQFIENLIGHPLIPARLNYATLCLVMNFDSAKDQATDEYVTVAQLAERYPAFTQGSIRWIIFNRENDGASKFVCKLGRKVIINLSKWKQWLAEHTA